MRALFRELEGGVEGGESTEGDGALGGGKGKGTRGLALSKRVHRIVLTFPFQSAEVEEEAWSFKKLICIESGGGGWGGAVGVDVVTHLGTRLMSILSSSRLTRTIRSKTVVVGRGGGWVGDGEHFVGSGVPIHGSISIR